MTTFTRGSMEFSLERIPSAEDVVDFDETLRLLVDSYVSSETNNYTLGEVTTRNGFPTIPNNYKNLPQATTFHTPSSTNPRIQNTTFLLHELKKGSQT